MKVLSQERDWQKSPKACQRARGMVGMGKSKDEEWVLTYAQNLNDSEQQMQNRIWSTALFT